MTKAELTCPKCGHKQETNIPESGCLAYYKCDSCQKINAAPEGICCIICAYSDSMCPVSTKG
ncbi:MAG: hypothetical protein M1536_04795 [Firmicutes bacterium]|nr:hypothetical protein [Bacillota bacterium]